MTPREACTSFAIFLSCVLLIAAGVGWAIVIPMGFGAWILAEGEEQ
jgi:hypothetical protein